MKHEFQAVLCRNKKGNGFECKRYLGAIETSRPNMAYHYCAHCKITYMYVIDESGLVESQIVKEKGQLVSLPSGSKFRMSTLPYTSTAEVVDA